MLQITVKDNIAEFTRDLSNIQKRQIPFATSRALNDTAIHAQEAVVGRITRIFQNRKRWWLKQQPTGIKVEFSRKNKLSAAVYSNAYFLPLQEDGGLKKPKTARQLAVPFPKVPKKFHKAGGARELLASNRKAFSTPEGIFRRKGKKRYPIEPMFHYTPTANVSPVLRFDTTIEQTVDRVFMLNFSNRLEQALASAR